MATLFGIRHHGPGCAATLLEELSALAPDAILVEGPPDANDLLPLLGHAETVFPVAVLVYLQEAPAQSLYYPFAEYSPETQAIRWALQNQVPVQFMDLPCSNLLQVKVETEPEQENDLEGEGGPLEGEDIPPTGQPEVPAEVESVRRDPLRWLAEAAGYADSERWWEDLVEHRNPDSSLFQALQEAMTALRAEVDREAPRQGEAALYEERREASMRQAIRAAERQGYQNVAVVCGAWHTPALSGELAKILAEPGARRTSGPGTDAALLKGLPKAKTHATLIPWTNSRLLAASGYGAGVTSPSWYEHLWESRERVAVRWFGRMAVLLREKQLDISPAHLIEAVRLAETLTAFRGRTLPSLEELEEAALATFCHGDNTTYQLIARQLLVGDRLGQVPRDTPMAPIQKDLSALQKRLRLPATAEQKGLDLDLRKPTDLERSLLLHRLGLLEVAWGILQGAGSGKGTFHEVWQLTWAPELDVQVIEAGRWGSTVEAAATTRARQAALDLQDLPGLSHLVNQVLLADLPGATDAVVSRLEEVANLTTDIAHLMAALPPLARLLRYGDVRGTRPTSVNHFVSGLLPRIFINLGPAVRGLTEEAAAELLPLVRKVNEAIGLLEDKNQRDGWLATLRALASHSATPGLLAGATTRLYLDGQGSDEQVLEEVAAGMSLALSSAATPERAASWIEGFLGNSILLLVHDDRLWALLDGWVRGLSQENFIAILPLLRRTFSRAEIAERRLVKEKVRESDSLPGSANAAGGVDWERANLVFPILRKLLGQTEVKA